MWSRRPTPPGELKDVYNKLMTGLCQMKDIRNSLRRCAAGETPDHVELFEIKGYLQRLDGMRPLFEQINAVTHFKGMTFHEVKDALAVLDPDGTGSRGFYIPDSATAKLKEIRSAKKEVEERLFHAQTDAEKDDLRLKRTRLCGEEDAEEMHVRKAMGAALAPMVDDLLSDAETAGRLDFIIQKALFAVRYGGVKPELTEKDLELEDMINPEICDLLEQQGRRFVPVSISLTPGATVITGANMGGKSVAMKTVALNVLLLQAGFLVCAKKARMPLFHSVKMLFDDLQSIQSGLSGFGSEIVQFQKALSEVEQGYSLFLLDEFARGTNPDEGAVIVQAVTRYLNGVDAISLLTTHYDKVAEYARTHYQIIGLRDIDPEAIRRGAGRDQRGRRGSHRAAHELRPVSGGGKVRLPAGRAEYLPDAVPEAGDTENGGGKLLKKRPAGRFFSVRGAGMEGGVLSRGNAEIQG